MLTGITPVCSRDLPPSKQYFYVNQRIRPASWTQRRLHVAWVSNLSATKKASFQRWSPSSSICPYGKTFFTLRSRQNRIQGQCEGNRQKNEKYEASFKVKILDSQVTRGVRVGAGGGLPAVRTTAVIYSGHNTCNSLPLVADRPSCPSCEQTKWTFPIAATGGRPGMILIIWRCFKCQREWPAEIASDSPVSPPSINRRFP